MFEITQTIREKSLLVIPILIAVTFHEIAHGLVAEKFGDSTAKNEGRLTVNPLKHLDLLGSLVFIVTGMIGWAKPVPINPYNLRNPRKDMLWIALAGPASNILIAVLLSMVFKMLISLVAFLPQTFFSEKIIMPIIYMTGLAVSLNIGLAVFNVIPVPPLDGSKILMGLLSEKHAAVYSRIEPYGFIILLLLVFTHVIHYLVYPVIMILRNLLLN